MPESETAAIISLQSQLRVRLAELGLLDGIMLENLSRHLAHIAVLGRNVAENTLPLLLSIHPEHCESISTLASMLKCDLDELRDALTDVEPDMTAFSEWLRKGEEHQ